VSKPDANFIWEIANLLRGPYKPKEYGDVVLPMTILRRLDCVLGPTRQAVHQEWIASRDKTSRDILDVKLRKKSGYSFYNTSRYTVPTQPPQLPRRFQRLGRVRRLRVDER
jgi:type I restriction enzyme M protein